MSSDRERLSAIAHGDLAYHNPLDPAIVEEVAGLAALSPGARVLDVGCGPGELLIALAERHGATGLGTDAAEVQIEAARRRAAERAPDAGLRFEVADGAGSAAEHGPFDLAACLGSSHAFGTTEDALARLAELVRPGGHVLLAEGFWLTEPDPGYLEALGAARDELTGFGGLMDLALAAGLEPVYCSVVGQREWDRYEWRLVLNLRRHVDAHPGDPLEGAALERIDGVRRRLAAPGGRTTLGFALMLLLRPGEG